MSILAPPGRYTVQLRVGGTELRQPLTIVKDPQSGGAPGELIAQTAMLTDIAKSLDASGNLYASIDKIRGQLAAASAGAGGVGAAVDSLEQQFAFLADSLTQQKPGAFYEWPVRLSAKLTYVASEVQSSDRRPTDQAREALAELAELESQLAVVQQAYTRLMATELPRLNARLQARGIRPISVIQP